MWLTSHYACIPVAFLPSPSSSAQSAYVLSKLIVLFLSEKFLAHRPSEGTRTYSGNTRLGLLFTSA